MRSGHPMWRQPKPVWAVAFASVVALMGIGLVDPILKPIADTLHATSSQVLLLFTSYLAVMGVAMLVTGVVSSRIGPKNTLLIGLGSDQLPDANNIETSVTPVATTSC
jgi:MFS transporter, ACDE family, multidrug resistance protein